MKRKPVAAAAAAALVAAAAVGTTALVRDSAPLPAPCTDSTSSEPVVGKPGTVPAAAPAFQVTGPVACQRIYRVTWPSATGTVVGYRFWLDSQPTNAMPAYKGTTQSFSLPLACSPAGVKHLINLQTQLTYAGPAGPAKFGPKRTTAATVVAKCGS